MSINISSWLGIASVLTATPTATEQQRAALAWRRILDKSTAVAFKNTAGTIIAAQTLRIETDSNASVAESAAGATAKRRVIVFGIRNHATLTNSDIKEGYRFIFDGDELRCVDTILTLGEIQGVFESAG